MSSASPPFLPPILIIVNSRLLVLFNSESVSNSDSWICILFASRYPSSSFCRLAASTLLQRCFNAASIHDPSRQRLFLVSDVYARQPTCPSATALYLIYPQLNLSFFTPILPFPPLGTLATRTNTTEGPREGGRRGVVLFLRLGDRAWWGGT
jgi:hypothetical protein